MKFSPVSLLGSDALHALNAVIFIMPDGAFRAKLFQATQLFAAQIYFILVVSSVYAATTRGSSRIKIEVVGVFLRLTD